MLKVYRVNSYVSVNGGKWYRVGRTGVSMFDDSNPKEMVYANWSFNKWCEYLQQSSLGGIYYSTTFFKKKPCIVTHEYLSDSYEKYTKFDTLSYKDVCEEMPDVSLNYIMDNFPADQCIQYLKERGITTCPMNF